MPQSIESIVQEHNFSASDVITPEQLPRQSQQLLAISNQDAPKHLHQAKSDLTEIEEKYQRLRAMQPPRKESVPTTTRFTRVLRWIDDKLNTSLEHGYKRNKRREAKHEHNKKIQAFNKERYEKIRDLRQQLTPAAEEYTAAQKRISDYVQNLKRQQEEIREGIEEQKQKIRAYAKEISTIDNILESEEHAQNKEFYANHADANIQELYEEKREETAKQLEQAIQTYKFLESYKTDHIPEQLERAQDTLRKSREVTVPKFREITAELTFAEQSYTELTQPMQIMTSINNVISGAQFVIDDLDDGQKEAKSEYDNSIDSLELNANFRKKLRGN